MQDADNKSAEGDFERAVNLYEATLDDCPRGAEVHYRLALLYDDKLNDPAFIFLRRAGDLLAVSSYGSGPIQQSVALVMTEDVDALFAKFVARGLKPAKPDSPVHRGPTDQTWGTREFSVNDPDGNTLAFTQTMS